MAWTWVAEDFNRSDRLLDGDNVGASALTWEHWNSAALTVNAPRIIGNVPTTANVHYAVQWLAADVAPLAAGASILGVGVEAQFTSRRSTDGDRYFGELFAAIADNFSGSMAWVQTSGPGKSAQVYSSTVAGSGMLNTPAVGMVSTGWPRNRTANISSTTAIGAAFGPWADGTTVRLEVVYGGNITVFYDGTAAITRATPASVNGNTIVSGNLFRSYWNHDNWRVGVLT